jgi:O-antigen/teichoic acid export membrane protein
VWRYAASIAVISALSLILTQSDRIVLARLVTTAKLGEYAAAYNLLFGLTLIQLFIGSAMYPSFASDFATLDISRIRDRHHDAAQVIIYLYAMPFSLLAVFGEPVLDLLLSPEAARSASGVLALLAIGFLFNALAAVPYALSIAGGLSRLPMIINAVSLAWYLPALILGVVAFGPAGAAAAWLALNVSYVFTLIPAAQRRLLGVPAFPGRRAPRVWPGEIAYRSPRTGGSDAMAGDRRERAAIRGRGLSAIEPESARSCPPALQPVA